MTMLRLAKIKETLFGMFYVMNDGRAKPSPNAMRNLIFLFVIDFCQVLRVMLSPMYGWNEKTYDVAKHIDVVYNTTKLLSFLVPRYTFFALAFLLVGFAIGNAVYCARLFKAGEIKKIGPVKALRFMVAVVVTTLFSSTMKWLLIPLECLASDERSLSSYIHGEDAACSPWRFPEILLTAPTLVLIPLYVAFALTASLFSLGTNPLACAPHVQFTGRIEVLFVLGKCHVSLSLAGLSTFLVFLSETITPVATTAILFFLFAGILYRHLSILPFHHRPTNILRGGIYCAICWLATSSLVVSVIKHNDLLAEDTFQTMQWLMVGSIPVSFTVGCWLVSYRYQCLLFSLDRLRGEFEHHAEDITPDATPMPSSTILGMQLPSSPTAHGPHKLAFARRGSLASMPSHGGVPRSNARGRTNYDNFFDPSWERKRAFTSGKQAHTVARMVLMQRQEWDLPFLSYVIFRSLEEHPDSQQLQVFRLSLLRFVFRSTTEAASEEKKLKSSNVALAVDHEYVLYAVERKASQDYAASNMGQGHFNAINLMEFDSGMQTAREAHLRCVMEMRKFWNNVSSQHKKKDFAAQIKDSVHRRVEFNKALDKAQSEYDQLLEKYPQSQQLLLSYASFCDAVLNDIKAAEEMRRQASLLEGGDGFEEEADGKQQRLEQDEAQSAATSEQETFRLQVLRQFNEWSKQIFGLERQALKSMDRRVRVCFLFLLASSTAAYLVMQLWLFRDMAKRDIHLINLTGLLRAWAATSMFLIRTQQLKAIAGDAEGMTAVQETIQTLSGKLQAQHWSNYEIIRTQRVEDFYLEPHVEQLEPTVDGWEVHHLSYWHFGNDWSRRMERSSTNTMEELQDEDWSLAHMGEGRQNIQYMTENGFRTAIPHLEEIVTLYEDEMKALWTLTQRVVAISTAVSLGFICVIAGLTTYGVKFTVQRMQHMYLACVMAIQLPTVTTKKLHHFYRDAEQGIRAIEDDQNEQHLPQDDHDYDHDHDQAFRCQDAGAVADAGQGPRKPGLRASLSMDSVEMEQSVLTFEITPADADPTDDDHTGTLRRETSASGPTTRSRAAAGATPLRHVASLSTDNVEAFKLAYSPLRDKARHFSLANGTGITAAVDSESPPVAGAADAEKAEVLAVLTQLQRSPEAQKVLGDSQHSAALARLAAMLEKEYGALERGQAAGAEEAEDGKGAGVAEEQSVGCDAAVQKDVEITAAREQTAGEEEAMAAEMSASAGIVFVEREGKREDVTGGCKGLGEEDGAGLQWSDGASGEGSEGEASADAPQGGTEADAIDRRSVQQQAPAVLQDKLPVALGGADTGEGCGNAAMMREEDTPKLASHLEPRVMGGQPLPVEDVSAHAAGGRTGRSPIPLPSPFSHKALKVAAAEGEHWSRGGHVGAGPHSKPCLKSDVTTARQASGESQVRFEAPGSWKYKGSAFSESFQSMGSKASDRVKRLFGRKERGSSSPNRRQQQQKRAAFEDVGDVNWQGHMLLNEVPAEQDNQIRVCLSRRWSLAIRTSTHALLLAAVAALSVLNTNYPARRMDKLVTLAPTINQAGRRRFLTRSCIHLARELVLDDGFARMSRVEIASALNFYLEELRIANDAVRLGGALNITIGADKRNPISKTKGTHNEIIYGSGCPWRQDPSDCTTPDRPGAASNGLYHLSLSFMDAVKSVLKRYGPDESEYTDDFLRHPRLHEDFSLFERVSVDPEKTKLLTEDRELSFILSNFKGDLFTGFHLLVLVFDEELADIITDAMADNQNIFIVYSILTFGGAYFLIRHAVAQAHREAEKARAFVARIPAHALSQLEIDTVAHIFSPEHATEMRRTSSA